MGTISFVPQQWNLQLYQGGTVLLICAVTDANGNAINMTGGSIVAKIRASQSNSSTLLATFTVTWVAQSSGQFNLSLLATTTDAFTFGSAYWDCFYIDSNTPANYYPLLSGTVTLQNDVSY